MEERANESATSCLLTCDRHVQSRARVSYCTFRLKLAGPGVARFGRSATMRVVLPFSLVFVAALSLGPLFLSNALSPDFVLPYEGIVLLVGIVLAVTYLFAKPMVFDKGLGRFWQAGRANRVVGGPWLLKDIAGLQLCSQKVEDSEGGFYYAYELNVVMNTPPAERITLLCHGDRNALIADAETLSQFLNVPLADHTFFYLTQATDEQ